MGAYEQSNAVPHAGTGNLLSNKIWTTTVAIVTVIACATSAIAQSVPNKVGSTDSTNGDPPLSSVQLEPAPMPDPDSSAAAMSASPTAPVDNPVGTPKGGSSAPSANELAKEISNPVTGLWQLQLQFNNYELENGNSNPEGGKWVNNLYFQPVLPVSLTNNINLITRPVMSIFQSVPHPTLSGSNARTTAFGDTVLATVLSPANTEPWIFGAGPTWILPTAGSRYTGQGKWQVGPAVGGGYITDKFMIAALVQQWWSFAGHTDRVDTNQVNILPLAYSFFGDGWSVGYSGNILADWTARGDNVWTVPVGLSLGKVIKIGILPVQVQIAGQYFAARPQDGPKWNVQLQITPVIPRLINETLF